MPERLSIRFSEKLKEHMEERKKTWPVENPVAAIMFVSADGREEELVIWFYDKEELPSIGDFHIFNSDGTEFIFPQTQFHNNLDGRVLDVRDGRISVSD